MRRATLCLGWVCIYILATGGCPQSAELNAAATDPTPGQVVPAGGNAVPSNPTPGVNPLAPVPTPIKVPPLGSPDSPWTGPDMSIGWYVDPADGYVIPARDTPVVASGGAPAAPAGGGSAAATVWADASLPLPSMSDAVDSVSRQLDAMLRLYGCYGELGNDRLTLQPSTIDTWGKCPKVTVLSGYTTSIIALRFDRGCSADSTGGDLVIGSAGEILYASPAPAAMYVVNGFRVNGHFVAPRLGHPNISETLAVLMDPNLILLDDGAALVGPCGFETIGVGTVHGDVNVHIGRDYVFDYTDTVVTFSDGAAATEATLQGLSVRPAVHGNFVPESGTATFPVLIDGDEHSLRIAYTMLSPTSGLVSVQVDNDPPTDHYLPAELLP